MKITKTQLKRIIKEELSRVLEAYELAGTAPTDPPSPRTGAAAWEEAERVAGHTILKRLAALYKIDENIVYFAAANAYADTHDGTPWTAEQIVDPSTKDHIAETTAPIWNVDDYVDDAGKLKDPTGAQIINAMISQGGYHDDIFADLDEYIAPRPSPTASLRSQASTSNEDEPWMEQLKRRMS